MELFFHDQKILAFFPEKKSDILHPGQTVVRKFHDKRDGLSLKQGFLVNSMKKRNAALFLVLLLMLSLFAACGKKDAPAQETPASSTESSAPQESKEEAPAQESASEEVTEEQSEEESTVETPETSEEESEEESEVSETTPEPAALVEGGLSLTLVSSISNNGWQLQSQYEDGFYYRDGDLYGIMNMDGSSSTGSIFASVSKEGKLFVVTSDASEFVLETESLNRYGVVDSEGRIIVPEEYAGFKDAGDRYITAIKVI